VFFVDTDLTRSDGIIRCREITVADELRMTWRFARALKWILEHPLPE
jgi:hypothetical protein